MLTHANRPWRIKCRLNGATRSFTLAYKFGDRELMGSDAAPDRFDGMKGFSVSLQVDNPAEAERIFNALASNGTVRMPLQQTFWAAKFGMLVDQFGTPWMINCEQPA